MLIFSFSISTYFQGLPCPYIFSCSNYELCSNCEHSSFNEKGRTMSSLLNDKDYVASLEKGLSVLSLFNEKNMKITLSETANLLHMTRATARRFLKTLEVLGYLESDTKYYWLTPKVLNLSRSFLTSNSFYNIAQYYIKQLAIKTKETSYISINNDFFSTVIACAQVQRRMQVNVQLGDLELLWNSSSGRIFLSNMDDQDFEKYIKNIDFSQVGEFSIQHPDDLRVAIKRVKDQGYCFIDQEQEKSLVSLSIPLRNLKGDLIATLNIIGADSRFKQADIIRKIEYMYQTANDIKNSLII